MKTASEILAEISCHVREIDKCVNRGHSDAGDIDCMVSVAKRLLAAIVAVRPKLPSHGNDWDLSDLDMAIAEAKRFGLDGSW